jgi:Condensation domain
VNRNCAYSLAAHTEKPFDLAKEIPIRTLVARLADDEHILLLTMHHVATEGPSMRILHHELGLLYRTMGLDQASIDHWAVVENAPATRLASLPDHPRGEQVVSERHVIEFDAALRERLSDCARHLRVPLRSLLLAAHLRVLALISGQSEVMTGVVVHGRPETDGGAEIAGLFLNTVPVKGRANARTYDLVVAVDEEIRALLPHRRFLSSRSSAWQSGLPCSRQPSTSMTSTSRTSSSLAAPSRLCARNTWRLPIPASPPSSPAARRRAG